MKHRKLAMVLTAAALGLAACSLGTGEARSSQAARVGPNPPGRDQAE